MQLLDEYYYTDATRTSDLIQWKNQFWGDQKILETAVAAKYQKFVAHNSCQDVIVSAWNKDLLLNESFDWLVSTYVEVKLILCISLT